MWVEIDMGEFLWNCGYYGIFERSPMRRALREPRKPRANGGYIPEAGEYVLPAVWGIGVQLSAFGPSPALRPTSHVDTGRLFC